ncbi:MAG: PepSY-associated TM helix domain-containing protein [Bacteroidota bacterium]
MKHPIKRILKKSIGWLHLWIGLVAGLIILISMFGAAVFVWEDELTNWYYQDLVFVPEVGEELLPPSELFQVIEEAYPGEEFRSFGLSNDPRKGYTFFVFKRSASPGWTWWSTIDRYERIYVDPYQGKVLGSIDMKHDWIQNCRRLHQNLLLYPKVGEMIVGIAALIMIFMALSGLYLWWPKNWRMLKMRLKIKWKARWRRVNWDLHSVGGFYTYLFILFFATTGLVWTFNWWRDGIYHLLGNDPQEVFAKHELPVMPCGLQMEAVDIAFEDAIQRQNSWYEMSFRRPSEDQEEGEISAFIRFKHPDSWWETSDSYAYHPETGALYWDRTHEDKLLGEKWRNANYAMHVGSIYGWPTKIIAFISALFFAFLPISGFLIWWGRKKKKKAKRKNKSSSAAKQIPRKEVVKSSVKPKPEKEPTPFV